MSPSNTANTTNDNPQLLQPRSSEPGDRQPPIRHDPRRPYIFSGRSYPEVAASALHLAAYNGRTAHFRQLLGFTAAGNIHGRLRSRYYCTPLQVALGRGHLAIATICVDALERDLATVAAHFRRIGGQLYESHFWLRERMLIALGDDHVQFVRRNCGQLEADPARMNGRKGLIVLLKPETGDGGVVWLHATSAVADSDLRLSRIVAHISTRGGELDVVCRFKTQYHEKLTSLLDLAAQRNFRQLFDRMHAAFGRQLLTPRAIANCCRLLVEHQPVTQRRRQFAELCMELGGFEVADLFGQGERGDVGDGQELEHTFAVLQDAMEFYNGDMEVLDLLVESAAERLLQIQPQLYANRAQAISAVIDMRHPTQLHCLFGLAFCYADSHLPWHCLRYRPTLMLADRDEYRSTWLSYLLKHPFNWFDERLHQLIVEQLTTVRVALIPEMFVDLCTRPGWLPTVRSVWPSLPSEIRQLYTENVDGKRTDLLVACLSAQTFEVFRFVMGELAATNHPVSSAERLKVLADWLEASDATEELQLETLVSDDVWDELVGAGFVGETVAGAELKELVIETMGIALRKRQLGVYRRICVAVDGWLRVEDIIRSSGTALLQHAIFETTLRRPYIYPDRLRIDNECPELIDQLDDAETSAHKNALNRERQSAWPDTWRPPRLLANATLQADYLELFRSLLASHPSASACVSILLSVAVARDNLDVVRLLLAQRLEANPADSLDNLVVTSHVQSVAALRLLPSASKAGNSPLLRYLSTTHWSVQDADFIRELLAVGWPVDERVEATGETALHLLPSVAVAGHLLRGGANASAVDNRGRTAVHRFASREQDAECDSAERCQLLQLLLDVASEEDLLRADSDDVCALWHLASVEYFEERHLRAVFGEQVDDPALLVAKFADREHGRRTLCRLFAMIGTGGWGRWLRWMLEQPDWDVEDKRLQWRGYMGFGRFLLEAAASCAQRTSDKSVDWSTWSEEQQPDDLLAELEWLADNVDGWNLELSVAREPGETALVRYCSYMSMDCEQTEVVSRLVAAGAKYGMRRAYDGKRALEGTVLECLYERAEAVEQGRP